MRYRDRILRLSGTSGRECAAWIGSWDCWTTSQPDLRFTSVIIDDLGRNKVNPLHSYQIRASRSNSSVTAVQWPGAYKGELAIANEHMHPGFLVETSLQSMSAWATKGAQRARTLDPLVDLPVIAGELTEARQLTSGLDNIVGAVKAITTSKKDAIQRLDALIKGVGDSGLYVLFGLKPLAESVSDLLSAHAVLDAAVGTALRNNGKWRHQHVKLLGTSTSSTDKVGDICWPAKLAQSWLRESSGTITTLNSEDIWFEADVRYDLPSDELSFGSTPLRRRLLGGDFDGSVLYELYPYSWLLDWFTSAGAMVSNSMDHTFYRWRNECIMHKTVRKVNLRGHMVIRDNGVDTVHNPTGHIQTTVKRRMPYVTGSLGLTLPELNDFQLAIAAFLAAAKA